MKPFQLFLLLWLACSCSSKKEQAQVVQTAAEPERLTEQPVEPVSPTEPKDTTSFIYFLQLTDEIFEEIPRHLIDTFIGTRWDDENDLYRKIYSEETAHYRLYNNYVLTFSVSMYGVAGQTILATYTPAGKMIDHIQADNSSDHDGASASYSYCSFEIFADSLLRIKDYRIKAKNYDFILPDSLNLDTMDSTEVIETTKYTHYVIKGSGLIKGVIPQQTILKEEDLQQLSKAELRIKRNEFFAHLGYIFQSDDLKMHFEKTDWYSPRFEDVTDQLTAFDRYNINLIKRIEDSK